MTKMAKTPSWGPDNYEMHLLLANSLNSERGRAVPSIWTFHETGKWGHSAFDP